MTNVSPCLRPAHCRRSNTCPLQSHIRSTVGQSTAQLADPEGARARLHQVAEREAKLQPGRGMIRVMTQSNLIGAKPDMRGAASAHWEGASTAAHDQCTSWRRRYDSLPTAPSTSSSISASPSSAGSASASARAEARLDMGKKSLTSVGGHAKVGPKLKVAHAAL